MSHTPHHITQAGGRTYVLVTDPATQFPEILDLVRVQPNISIDTETTSIDVPTFGPDARCYGISIAPTPELAYYLPLGHAGPYQRYPNLDHMTVVTFMHSLLGLNVPVVYHNAAYDRSVLHAQLGLSPELTSNYHDTVLMAHLLNENQAHGLKPLAVQYLGVKPEVTKLDDQLDTFIERHLTTEERKVPNKLGRMYTKKFYTLTPGWEDALLQEFIRGAGGAASYKVSLGYAQKLWSVLRKHDVPGYEELPKPFDFQYVPTEIANVYASDDVMNTLALYRLWDATFFDLNPTLQKLYREVEQPVDDIMTRATIQGIPTSRAYLQDMKLELTVRAQQAREHALAAAEKLITPGDERYNTATLLTSTKQLAALLFEDLGFPVQGRTEKGAPQVNKDALKKLLSARPRKRPQAASHAHDLIRSKLQIADLDKINGTYTDGLIEKLDRHDRIHPSYNVAGTVSGRMSSNNPNFQNMPRLLPEELKERSWLAGIDIRQAMHAEDDYVFVDVDFTAMEMVMTAALSQDENLIQLLKDGRDLHCHTARYAFKVGLEMDDAEFKKKHKVERQKAKIVNFAMVYGGTEFTLQKNFGFSESEAKMAVAGYFEGFPGVKLWMEDVYAQLRKTGYIDYPQFGYRKRMDLPDKMLEFTDPKAYQRQYRAALRTCQNALIQGWSAFIVKKAIIDIHRELQARALDAWVCLQIHDEIGCMARKDLAQTVQEIMMRHMQQHVNGVFLGADPEIKLTLSKNEEALDPEELQAQLDIEAALLELQL